MGGMYYRGRLHDNCTGFTDTAGASMIQTARLTLADAFKDGFVDQEGAFIVDISDAKDVHIDQVFLKFSYLEGIEVDNEAASIAYRNKIAAAAITEV